MSPTGVKTFHKTLTKKSKINLEYKNIRLIFVMSFINNQKSGTGLLNKIDYE